MTPQTLRVGAVELPEHQTAHRAAHRLSRRTSSYRSTCRAASRTNSRRVKSMSASFRSSNSSAVTAIRSSRISQSARGVRFSASRCSAKCRGNQFARLRLDEGSALAARCLTQILLRKQLRRKSRCAAVADQYSGRRFNYRRGTADRRPCDAGLFTRLSLRLRSRRRVDRVDRLADGLRGVGCASRRRIGRSRSGLPQSEGVWVGTRRRDCSARSRETRPRSRPVPTLLVQYLAI